MRRFSLIAFAALLLGTATAGPSATAEAQWLQSKNAAQSFLETAAMASRYGVESSKIAIERSQTPSVRQFAEALIVDYTKAYDDLARIAQFGSFGLPVGLKASYQDRLKTLQDAPAEQFDEVYLDAQAKAQWEADFYLSQYARSDHQVVRSFVARTLPMLDAHEQNLRQFARR